MKMSKKPLLAIVLLTILIGGVGAAFVSYWSAQINRPDIEYKLYGLDGLALQIPVGTTGPYNTLTYDSYIAGTTATSFEGIYNTNINYDEAVIIAVDDTNLPLTGGLTILVNFTNTETVSGALTDVGYCMAYIDVGSDKMFLKCGKTEPTIIDNGDETYTIIIAQADVEDLTYDPDYSVAGGDPEPNLNVDGNCLVLNFAFTGNNRPAEEGETWGSYYGSSLVQISLGVDE